MHTPSLFATTSLALLAALSGVANADHDIDRVLDELNNHAMQHARDARWEIHDHFAGSREYDDLLQDSRTLTKALRNVEDAIFFERSPPAILALVEDAYDALIHFEQHAGHSQPSRSSWRGHTEIRPAGNSRVVELRSILANLHEDMDQLVAVLEPLCGHGHGRQLEVIPDPQFRIPPGPPSRGPVLPGVRVPGQSATSGVAVPLVRTRSGGVVLPVARH